MKNDINHEDMASIISMSEITSPASSKTDERVFSFLSDYSGQKKPGTHISTFFRYHPSRGLLLIIPLVFALSLALLAGFLTRTGNVPILVFASGTVTRTNDDMPLSPGTRLKETDTFSVPEKDIGDVVLPVHAKRGLTAGTTENRCADFRFFPGTRFSVVTLNPSSKKMIIELLDKSVYVNKYRKPDKNRELRIRIRDYEFAFTGTRVFLSVDDRRIVVSCFEGMVKALLYKTSPERELFTLYEGEKFEVIIHEGEPQYTIKRLSKEDFRIDQLLQHFPPYDPDLFSGLSTGYTNNVEKPEPVKKVENQDKQDAPVLQPVEKPGIEPFTITKVGILDDPALAEDKPHFIAAGLLNDSVILHTEKKLYVLKDSVLQSVAVPEKTGFCMKPLIYKDSCFLITSWDIFAFDIHGIHPEPFVSITKNEKLYFHYRPVIHENDMYIPATNTGYYKAHIIESGPRLEKVFDEGFPVSPVVTGEGMYIGSYLEHFIAFINTNGTMLWKYDLPGELTANMALSGEYIFVLCSSGTNQYIVQINKNGEKVNQWHINNICYTDMIVYDNKVFGITIKGELFQLHTGTGACIIIDTIITTGLRRKLWRGISLFTEDSLVYTGTDTGDLLCYNMKQGKKEYKITVNEKESFYATPCKKDNEILIIANSGAVYSVVKNE